VTGIEPAPARPTSSSVASTPTKELHVAAVVDARDQLLAS
jgi:hypothetical protein